MSIVKLATNRMTKEKMYGNLSNDSIKKIQDFDNRSNLSAHSYLNKKINKKGNIIPKSTLRSEEQIAEGLYTGNINLAKKLGYDVEDSAHWSLSKTVPKAKGFLKNILNNVGYKEKTIYFSHGTKNKRSVLDQVAGRHEVFEAMEMPKEVSIKDAFTGKSALKIKNNGRLVGAHANLRVLGKESNEISRLFNTDLLNELTSYRTRSGEENAIKGITNKSYTKSYLDKKDLLKLKNYKPNKFAFSRYIDILRAGKGKSGLNYDKIIGSTAAGLAGVAAVGYGTKKYLNNRDKK